VAGRRVADDRRARPPANPARSGRGRDHRGIHRRAGGRARCRGRRSTAIRRRDRWRS
jgi:hypothetical protein